MNAKEVIDEIADKLGTISALRVYPHDVGKVSPPAAIVGLPDTVTYDETYGRGMDTFELPLFVMVTRADLQAATSALAEYLDGAGLRSVKAAVDSSGTNAYNSCDTVRVMRATPFADRSGGIEVLGAEFTIHVSGSGS